MKRRFSSFFATFSAFCLTLCIFASPALAAGTDVRASLPGYGGADFALDMEADYSLLPAVDALEHLRGYMDLQGRMAILLDCDQAQLFHEGLAVVSFWDREQGLFWDRVIDKTGAFAFEGAYHYISAFREGRATVGLRDAGTGTWRCGVVDTGGRLVAAMEYDNVSPYYDGVARTQLQTAEGTVYGWIDREGRSVEEPQDWGPQSASAPSHDLRVVWQEERAGVVSDTEGQVTPCEYNDAVILPDGTILVVREGDDPGRFSIYGVNADSEKRYTAYVSALKTVKVNGQDIALQLYALRSASGYETNYIRVRDAATILNGTSAQFSVGWQDGMVQLTTGQGYVGSLEPPFTGERSCRRATSRIRVDGQPTWVEAIFLRDDQGSEGYTYVKLRDLGRVLGFDVTWGGARGILIETK